ncbi:hypothetical protein N9N03_01915 [Chlamydiia bacterium]|nr:hypothetical protein [Chlamydiia bacterium]
MVDLLNMQQLRVGHLFNPTLQNVTNIVAGELLASLTDIHELGLIRSTLETIQYEKSRIEVDSIPLSVRITVHTCSGIASAMVSLKLQASLVMTIINYLSLPILIGVSGLNIRYNINHKLALLDPYQEGLTTFQRVRNVAIIVIAACAVTATLLFVLPSISAYVITGNFLPALSVYMLSNYVVQSVVQTVFYDTVDTIVGIGRCTDKHVKIEGWYDAGIVPYYHTGADIGDNVNHILPNKIEIIDSMRRLLEMSGKRIEKVVIKSTDHDLNTRKTKQPPFFDYDNRSGQLIVNLSKLNAYEPFQNIDCSNSCLSKDDLEGLDARLQDSKLNISSAVLLGVYHKYFDRLDMKKHWLSDLLKTRIDETTPEKLMQICKELRFEWIRKKCKERVEQNLDDIIKKISPLRFDIEDVSSLFETAESLNLFVKATFLYQERFIERYIVMKSCQPHECG